MELQHFSHDQHALVFSPEQNQQSEEASCSGCGELVSAPSYNCMACGFHLHKKCAEAPSKMNHPFHRNHILELLTKHPYTMEDCVCSFCNKKCENFVYHCSCNLDLHIKCALLSLNIAEKRIGELQNITRIDPSISTENYFEELIKAECFACWEPLLDSVYLSPDFGFYLHAKCVDLPTETNHPFHPQHPLVLQFDHEHLPSCEICQKEAFSGFVYCCSLCDFVLHIGCATIPTEINPWYHKHPLVLQFIYVGILCQICQEIKHRGSGYWCSTCKYALHAKCVSPPPIIEDKRHHQHQFILFPRPASFSCDACGTQGKYVSYICSTCGIMVHKNCISVPGIIKFFMHQHSIFHTYILAKNEFEMWECRFCHEEVNKEHGGYVCSKCNYIVHVKCATKQSYFYHEVVSAETVDEVMDSMENVTATSGNHFSHPHVLEFSEEIKNDKQCDGCGQFISTSNYCCSQCDFFLHKSCAELPTEKHMWFDFHQNPMKLLTSDCIFTCDRCHYETSGFAYVCGEYGKRFCIRCASISDMLRCEGHDHPLKYYHYFKGPCNACGDYTRNLYRCKLCNFILCRNCARLPLIARHKSDEHPLKLTYGDNSNYSVCYYCDICEKERNPNHWFYFCEICNTSAHPTCVIGKCSFIKPGSIYKEGDHPHPLTFVQKVHSYPECEICDEPCFDLALECKEIGCSYIVHWRCMKKPGSV